MQNILPRGQKLNVFILTIRDKNGKKTTSTSSQRNIINSKSITENQIDHPDFCLITIPSFIEQIFTEETITDNSTTIKESSFGDIEQYNNDKKNEPKTVSPKNTIPIFVGRVNDDNDGHDDKDKINLIQVREII